MRNPKFKEKLDIMLEIHEAKNHDYAGEGGDPYKNFRECERIGIPAWKGILVRIGDKYSRIMNLATTNPEVKNEKIEDTLLDLASYSILCLLMREELHDPTPSKKVMKAMREWEDCDEFGNNKGDIAGPTD